MIYLSKMIPNSEAAVLWAHDPSLRGPVGVRLTAASRGRMQMIGRGDDTVGNPHRAQIDQFELFELIVLLTLDKQFPVQQFEATASQSRVPAPPSETCLRVPQRVLGRLCSHGFRSHTSLQWRDALT